jgi:hypothetical protein
VNTLRLTVRSLAKVSSFGFLWWALDALNKIFDYGIYTAVVAYYGIIVGGAIMWIAAFVLDVSLLHIYSYFNKDIFGFEAIAEWKEYDGRSPWKRLRSTVLNMSDPIVYLFITIIANPFLATAYMRKTDKARKGMDKRDWKIFMVSFVISNLSWTLFSGWIAPITKGIGMYAQHLFGF